MALAILCIIIKDFVYQEFSAGPATALRLFANGDTLPDEQSRTERLGIKKKNKCLGHKADYRGVNRNGDTHTVC